MTLIPYSLISFFKVNKKKYVHRKFKSKDFSYYMYPTNGLPNSLRNNQILTE